MTNNGFTHLILPESSKLHWVHTINKLTILIGFSRSWYSFLIKFHLVLLIILSLNLGSDSNSLIKTLELFQTSKINNDGGVINGWQLLVPVFSIESTFF
jgi:hypothetical protein